MADPQNATRASCSLFQTNALSVEVEITDGEETAVFSSAAVQTIHVVPIWGLHAESEWTWTARAGDASVTGTLAPIPLPEGVTFDVARTGEGPSSLVHVLLPAQCAGGGTAVVLDQQGRVRWYEDLGGSELGVVTFTEANTILAMIDQDAIVELNLAGNEIYRLADLGLPLHHDVMRRGDLLYTLLAEARPATDAVTYVEDIVVAYDRVGRESGDGTNTTASTRRSPARGAGNFWDDEFPDAVDAWHTNGLFVTEDYDVILSLKGDDAVAKVTLGGIVAWGLYGDGTNGNGALPSSFDLQTYGGDPTFGNQHPSRVALRREPRADGKLERPRPGARARRSRRHRDVRRVVADGGPRLPDPVLDVRASERRPAPHVRERAHMGRARHERRRGCPHRVVLPERRGAARHGAWAALRSVGRPVGRSPFRGRVSRVNSGAEHFQRTA